MADAGFQAGVEADVLAFIPGPSLGSGCRFWRLFTPGGRLLAVAGGLVESLLPYRVLVAALAAPGEMPICLKNLDLQLIKQNDLTSPAAAAFHQSVPRGLVAFVSGREVDVPDIHFRAQECHPIDIAPGLFPRLADDAGHRLSTRGKAADSDLIVGGQALVEEDRCAVPADDQGATLIIEFLAIQVVSGNLDREGDRYAIAAPIVGYFHNLAFPASAGNGAARRSLLCATRVFRTPGRNSISSLSCGQSSIPFADNLGAGGLGGCRKAWRSEHRGEPPSALDATLTDLRGETKIPAGRNSRLCLILKAMPAERTQVRRWLSGALLPLLGLVALVAAARPGAPTAVEENAEVSPEAAAEIHRAVPDRGAAGGQVRIQIEGRDFSRGVYVSFSHPTVRVISLRRADDTRLEALVEISAKAPSETLRLYVSNPAGAVAEVPFTIIGGAVSTPRPSAPATVSAQAVAPSNLVGEARPSPAGAPEVTAVDPSRAAKGSEVVIKITGENFAPGAKVAFSNPRIRVFETRFAKPTELTARIQVASDAPTGATGLFVVNPDDSETEVPFQVTEEAAVSPSASASEPVAGASSVESLRFEVLNLGDGIEIFQTVNKPRGTLTFSNGKLIYEEAGKEVFSARREEIKEIDPNTILGVNTGTFHITLSSGKTFNFVPASLRPEESQSIIDAVRRALK